jgi:hypothetical protein
MPDRNINIYSWRGTQEAISAAMANGFRRENAKIHGTLSAGDCAYALVITHDVLGTPPGLEAAQASVWADLFNSLLASSQPKASTILGSAMALVDLSSADAAPQTPEPSPVVAPICAVLAQFRYDQAVSDAELVGKVATVLGASADPAAATE